eukprot:183975-Pelagomonas_calceolata.AAC.5
MRPRKEVHIPPLTVTPTLTQPGQRLTSFLLQWRMLYHCYTPEESGGARPGRLRQVSWTDPPKMADLGPSDTHYQCVILSFSQTLQGHHRRATGFNGTSFKKLSKLF